MSSTMQVLEFWRWKRMEIDAEIAKHPERQNALITKAKYLNELRNEIKDTIQALTEEYSVLLGVRK